MNALLNNRPECVFGFTSEASDLGNDLFIQVNRAAFVPGHRALEAFTSLVRGVQPARQRASDTIFGNGGGNTLTGALGTNLFFGNNITDWDEGTESKFNV